MDILRILMNGVDTLGQWKPAGGYHPAVVYADRTLGILGSFVFLILMSTGFILVPSIYILVYIFINPSNAMYLLVITVLCSQSIMAYLREGYFYDSFATYAFIGGICGLFLISLSTIALLHLPSDLGLTPMTVSMLTCFQCLQLYIFGIDRA